MNKTYLITCYCEDLKTKVVSHGVCSQTGRNICLPCETLDHFIPRFYDSIEGEWYLPQYAVQLTGKVLRAIESRYENIKHMAHDLDLRLIKDGPQDGYICFRDSESYFTFRMVYGHLTPTPI